MNIQLLMESILEEADSKFQDKFSNYNFLIDAENNYISLAKKSEWFKFKENERPTTISNEDLINLYEYRLKHKNKNARKFYIELLNQLEYCPYCFNNNPKTIDHYLSKSKFPILSICPKNLIVCCGACNTIKDAYHPISYDKQFFHPYYENINNYPFLDLLFEIKDGVINFYYNLDKSRITNKDEKLFFERLENQYNELNIYELFSISARKYFESKIFSYSIYYLEGKESLNKYLNIEYQNHFYKFNYNHWLTVLYLKLLDNDFLFNNIEKLNIYLNTLQKIKCLKDND